MTSAKAVLIHFASAEADTDDEHAAAEDAAICEALGLVLVLVLLEAAVVWCDSGLSDLELAWADCA